MVDGFINKRLVRVVPWMLRSSSLEEALAIWGVSRFLEEGVRWYRLPENFKILGNSISTILRQSQVFF